MNRDSAQWTPLIGERVRALYRSAIEKWGEDLQMDMAVEEMAELTKALIKFRRKPTNETRYAIAEEIADVQIMLEQLMEIFWNATAVDMARIQKLTRLEKRILEGAAVAQEVRAPGCGPGDPDSSSGGRPHEG